MTPAIEAALAEHGARIAVLESDKIMQNAQIDKLNTGYELLIRVDESHRNLVESVRSLANSVSDLKKVAIGGMVTLIGILITQLATSFN